ncbi:MAG: iron-containing alcohol dehydrogenase [Lachnospiraceae bacterium]|nr:iron-containing alcohol dehydrogenase [Lachnospiraceae bacterium]
MNPIRKAYCRAFQTCFKLALPILPYRKPKIFKSVCELPGLFDKKRIDKVLLVTDKSVRSLGLTEELEMCLKANDIELTIYDGTVANPTTTNVEDARALYIENECQALIGFGGGSPIDCAKAVGARIAKPNQPLSKMKGILKIHKRIPLLIAVPTTAGTGSETTLAAVITDDKTRHKYPINDFPLIPRYAVLDAKVTRSLPPSLTATTGMDALTHAVEAFIGNSTTSGTRKDSIKAVQLIFKYIRNAYNDGNDMVAREKMLYAAYLAGSAFTKSYVGYVHAVAHSLGGKYNVPHGFANAVLLPSVLEAYGEAAWHKLRLLADAIGLCDENDTDETGAGKFIEAIKAMKKDLNIGDTIRGINPLDIPKLAKHADREANPLYPVPKLMNAKELQALYYNVLEGKK